MHRLLALGRGRGKTHAGGDSNPMPSVPNRRMNLIRFARRLRAGRCVSNQGEYRMSPKLSSVSIAVAIVILLTKGTDPVWMKADVALLLVALIIFMKKANRIKGGFL